MFLRAARSRKSCVAVPAVLSAWLLWGVAIASASVEFDPVTHEPIQKPDPVEHASSSPLAIVIVVAVVVLFVFLASRARA
jgi:hypothetical protein